MQLANTFLLAQLASFHSYSLKFVSVYYYHLGSYTCIPFKWIVQSQCLWHWICVCQVFVYSAAPSCGARLSALPRRKAPQFISYTHYICCCSCCIASKINLKNSNNFFHFINTFQWLIFSFFHPLYMKLFINGNFRSSKCHESIVGAIEYRNYPKNSHV